LSPFAASSNAHSGSDEGSEAIFVRHLPLAQLESATPEVNVAQLSRNKFNVIKHHSTRFNISRSCRWNHRAKSHQGQTHEAAKSGN
jgi:hypothetical protein